MFETQGGTRNRTRDLPRKGSAFITSSDHWTCHSSWPQTPGGSLRRVRRVACAASMRISGPHPWRSEAGPPFHTVSRIAHPPQPSPVCVCNRYRNRHHACASGTDTAEAHRTVAARQTTAAPRSCRDRSTPTRDAPVRVTHACGRGHAQRTSLPHRPVRSSRAAARVEGYAAQEWRGDRCTGAAGEAHLDAGPSVRRLW